MIPDGPVAVCGLWHLGTTVVAGLAARGVPVAGFDEDPALRDGAVAGVAPTGEPGVAGALAAGAVTVLDTLDAWASHPLCVLGYDAEPDADGRDARLERAVDAFAGRGPTGAVLVVLSQVPAGPHDRWARRLGDGRALVHVPENLRLGCALEDFTRPPRLVVGLTDERVLPAVAHLFPAGRPEVMRPVEAELVKHATNAYLGLCITFANELGWVAAALGADPRVVADGLRADPRVADRAPLRPGGAFSGATLRRDLVALARLGARSGRPELFETLLELNERHAEAPLRVLDAALGTLAGRRIAVVGLTYKPTTATLRDSLPLALAGRLRERGAHVTAFDPIADPVPPETGLHRAPTLDACVTGADAVLVLSAVPEILAADWSTLHPQHHLVVDGCGALDPDPVRRAGWRYLTAGTPDVTGAEHEGHTRR